MKNEPQSLVPPTLPMQVDAAIIKGRGLLHVVRGFHWVMLVLLGFPVAVHALSTLFHLVFSPDIPIEWGIGIYVSGSTLAIFVAGAACHRHIISALSDYQPRGRKAALLIPPIIISIVICSQVALLLLGFSDLGMVSIGNTMINSESYDYLTTIIPPIVPYFSLTILSTILLYLPNVRILFTQPQA